MALRLNNIAMKNGPFEDEFSTTNGDFPLRFFVHRSEKKLPKISRWPWNIHLNFNMRYTSTQMVVAFPLACLFSRVYYSTNSYICIHIYFICIVYISICTFIFVCLYVHVCWDASLTLSKNHHLCYTILVWEISIVRGIWISMKQHLSFKQSLKHGYYWSVCVINLMLNMLYSPLK